MTSHGASDAANEGGGNTRCLLCWAQPFHYMTTGPLVRDAASTIQRYADLRAFYLATSPPPNSSVGGGDARQADSNGQWRQELQVVVMFLFMDLTQKGIHGLAPVPM